MAAKSNLVYIREVALRTVFLAVILFIFLRLWQVTYAQTGVKLLGGFSIVQMLWYLTLTEAIALSGPRVSQLVDHDVRTGALAVQLVKPFSYPLYRLSNNLGERLIRFLSNVVVGAILSLYFVGPLAFHWQSLPTASISLLLAFLIDFFSQFVIGLGAFWLEDTSGLDLLYSRLAMVLGGMLMPLELFPSLLQGIVKFMPFSTIYPAARLLVENDLSAALGFIGRQCCVAAVLVWIAMSLYRAALHRVAANGG